MKLRGYDFKTAIVMLFIEFFLGIIVHYYFLVLFVINLSIVIIQISYKKGIPKETIIKKEEYESSNLNEGEKRLKRFLVSEDFIDTGEDVYVVHKENNNITRDFTYSNAIICKTYSEVHFNFKTKFFIYYILNYDLNDNLINDSRLVYIWTEGTCVYMQSRLNEKGEKYTYIDAIMPISEYPVCRVNVSNKGSIEITLLIKTMKSLFDDILKDAGINENDLSSNANSNSNNS